MTLATAPSSHTVSSAAEPQANRRLAPVLADEQAPLRVLTFSSLFPSLIRPRHGIFVETRLRKLIEAFDVDARVIAPVPWFPFRSRRFGRYAAFAATAEQETRIDGKVLAAYPRYLMLPKVGVRVQPWSMARSAAPILDAWSQSGWSPDIIDAHYFYPDGVAAALLARRFGKPYLITARGTDVNVLARTPGPAEQILGAARGAAAVIAVSDGLRRALIELGVDGAKIHTLRNGVDLDVFRAEDPVQSRRRLGLPSGPLLASVGNLVPEKDQALAVRTLPELPGYHLAIVGDGPLRSDLEALGRRLGVGARVHFLAPMSQRELACLYSSVDALLLTSLREGWPNVVLESLACGTPVVAVDVGAAREMLDEPGAGRMIVGREPAAVAAAVREVASARLPRSEVRAIAARFDWTAVSAGQWRLFQQARASLRASPRSHG